MSQITDLPTGPMSRILLHLNAQETALFAQTCRATKHLPLEADSASTIACSSEVAQVIAIAEEHLKNIEARRGEAGQWMLDKQIMFARTNLALLKKHLGELENPAAKGTPLRGELLNQQQEIIKTLASRLLGQLNGMNPQSSCFQDIRVGKFGFLRRSLNREERGSQVVPNLDNRACGFVKCQQCVQEGLIDEAVATACAIENALEKEFSFSYICGELIRGGQLPKFMEVMDRIGDQFSCVTLLRTSWEKFYKGYSLEQNPDKKLEKASFLVQLLQAGHQTGGSTLGAIHFAHENGTVNDLEGLIIPLQKMAESPGLPKKTNEFISLALVGCATELLNKHPMRAFQLLSLVSKRNDIDKFFSMHFDEFFSMHFNEFFSMHFNENLHWPLLQNECFSDEFRGLAILCLVFRDLEQGNASSAEQRLLLIQHPVQLSDAHVMLATYYENINDVAKMAEHVPHIVNESHQMDALCEMSRLSRLMGNWDEAMIYASMMSENQVFPDNGMKISTRSAALYDLVENMIFVRAEECFERLAPLILSMRDLNLRAKAVSRILVTLSDPFQPNAVLERIMTLQDPNMRDLFLEAHFYEKYALGAEPARALAEQVLGHISNVNIRNNLKALMQTHLEEEQKEGT